MKHGGGRKGAVEEKTDVIFGYRMKNYIHSNVVVLLLWEFALANSQLAVCLCDKDKVIIDALEILFKVLHFENRNGVWKIGQRSPVTAM